MPTYGSVNISKGYYNNGTDTIISSDTQASLSDLKTGQTVGCKNTLFMTSASGTVAPYISSNNAPTGTFDVYAALNTPIYLNWTKEYIAGGAEIDPELSFVNSGYRGNYTTIGSPAISSAYVASDFSASNYLTTKNSIDFSNASTWEFITKVTVGSTSTDQKIIYGSGINFGIGSSGMCRIWLSSNGGSSWFIDSDVKEGSYFDGKWVKLDFTGSQYRVWSSTDGSSWTYWKGISSSTKVGPATVLEFGNHNGEYWRGSIDLTETYITIDGVEVWKAVEQIEPAISTQKALLYDNANDKTFWYPSETSVTLADVKSEQTVGMKNNLYLTNVTGSPAASITFCEGTPSGVTEYYQQPEYVWLNSSKDTILGVQEEPDEIDINLASTIIESYTIVGSPTISSEYVASNFSGSNYLTLPITIDSTDNTWEVGIDFTLTSSDPQHIFGVTNGDNAVIISAEYGVIRTYLSSGSGWDIAGAVGDYSYSLNTHYYVKLQFTGTNYILSVSTDKVNWTESANISSSTKIASGKTLYLGSCWDRNSQYLRGSMDLKNCYIKKDGAEVWRAVEGVTTTDYIVNGSPTITDEYVASGFNSSNYIQVNTLSSYSDFEYTTVVTPTATSGQNVIESNNRSTSYSMARIRDGYFGIWGPSQGWCSTGNAPASSGSTYWAKCVYDSSTLKLYVTGYTEGVNPPSDLSNWTLAGEVTDSSDVSGYGSYFTYETFFGFNKGYGEEFHGSIDLKHTSLKVNGAKVWEAVSTPSTNSIEVSQDHYWSYLQGDSYDAQGATLAVSGMSPSALTGHILVDTSGTLSYSEDANISQSALLPTKAYTGYDITFTDNTYTSIQSIDKVGTKCRIYSSNVDTETRSQLFVAIPVTEYEEGFEGGSLPYKAVVQSLFGLSTPLEYTTTDSFVVTTTPGILDYYNPTEDKFYIYSTIGVWTGFRALSYSGDAYILDSTGA